MKNITFPNVLRTIVLVAFISFFSNQSIEAQVVLFDADFTTTTGDNAWTNSAGDVNGSFFINTGAGYIINTPHNNYFNNTSIGAESPSIDFSGYGNLTLDLDIYINTEANWDGAQIQYSIAGGPWNVLGSQASGFYNDTDVDGIANDADGWSGFFGFLTTANTLNLSAFDPAFDGASNVRFKLVFGSDGSSTDDGVAFTNIIVRGILNTPLPEIEITGLGNIIPDNDTTPTNTDDTDFGTITSGSTLIKTYTINNTGTAPLLISGASITGATDFTISTPPPASIAAGSSSTFSVEFSPATGGTFNGTVTIANNDSNENPYNFNITGAATGPQPEIIVNGNANIITDGDTATLTSNNTDFGILLTGNSNVNTFQISNSGSADLLLTGASPYINITGGSGFFTVTAIPASTIIPGGGSTSFEITYNPTAVGTHTATVSIANNDSDESPFDFTITGQATNSADPEIEITGLGIEITDGDTTPDISDNTDFDTVFLGSSKAHDFNVNNIGTATLNLTGGTLVQIIGPGAGNFSVTSAPATSIASGASTTFQITYTPGAVGTHTATVRVRSNDSNENNYDFDITGSSIIDTNPLYTIHYDNFDVTNGGWIASNPGGASVWTYGTNTVEPGVDGNYWYTNNYNDYASGSDTYVTSPTIDLTGFQDLRLYIDVRFNLDNDFEDGMNIEYSSNGGTTWNVLGTNAEPAQNNWYGDGDINGLGSGVDGWTGNNSTVTAASKSRFSISYIDLPTILINNPLARFRVRFSDDNDGSVDDGANFDNFLIIGNPLVPFTDPTEGPASANTNLRLWLKANQGITATSGSQATSWTDNARDNDALVTDKDGPTYYDTDAQNINHNPVLNFNSADRTQLKGKGGFHSGDYWMVFKQNGTIDGTSTNAFQGIVSGRLTDDQFAEDGTGFWTGKISIRFSGNDNMLSHMIGSTPATADSFTENSYGRAYSSSTDSYTDEVVIINVKRNPSNNSSEIYKNGIRVDNTDAYAFNQATNSVGNILPYDEIDNSIYALGVSRAGLNRTDINTWFDGKMTEFISYASPNSTLDQKKIQSYLALKNGVTLHATASTTPTRQGDENYVDSNGTVYWDTAVNSGFTYDIAGIGKDVAATLDQKQSTSSNPGAIVTMGLTDIYSTNNENISTNSNTIADRNFLMWGNDNGTFAASAPIQVDMSAGIAGLTTMVDFTAIQRTWKVVETGSVGRVKVSVPEVALSSTITPPGNFLMFVSDTPSFSPTSEYRIMTQVGSELQTTYDFVGTKYITFGYAPEYIYERSITFDGVQDYMDADDVADLDGSFTLSSWVKREAGSNDKEILSKRNEGPYTEGYSLSINGSGNPRMVWTDASSTTRAFNSSISLPLNEWHHIAVIYDGTTATFYIDGYEDTALTAPAPAASTQHFMVAAVDYQNPTNFFDGTIDEVRVWNQALSQNQLRFIMNQEIEKFTDDSVLGKIIPQNISKNEVASIPWADLEIYLPMSRYTFTNVKDESDNNHVAAIKNLETVDFQTAPLPYVSASNGNWTNVNTWENGSSQELPGAPSLVDASQTIDWNIVQTSHDVTTSANNTVLSLDVDSAELSIENDSKIEVSHYLKLDGVMDLVGESQLVQTENSDLDPASIGRLERDQQGTADTFTYNLWSSPVGRVNTSAINQDYTVASIMNDGTMVNSPTPMNYSGTYNGAPTTPITISAYWFFTYRNNAADDYNAWEYLGPYGNIAPGDGYTMKGAGTGGILDPQNYTFIGKPNNSTTAVPIEKIIDAGNESLVGNPFPSALNADQFIVENPHLTGTLSFWEHWGGGSHYLADYQAGYALYNLSGGTPAVSHPDINQTGSGTKTPTPFVAVGQGFFVKATSAGTTTFSNSQRTFAKESTSSGFFFNSDEDETQDTSNIEDDIVLQEDLREKFRIGFDSPSQYHRQLLMTIDNNTTFGYDRAYDAVIEDHPQEDMTWMLEDDMAIILGVPAIENDRHFPVRITLPMNGEVSIGIDHFENVDTNNVKVYVLDTLLESRTEINREDKYTLDLVAGTYADRFYIVFERNEQSQEEENQQDNEEISDTHDQQDTHQEQTQDIEVIEVPTELNETVEPSDLSVFYNSQSSNITINKRLDYEIKSVQLFTILGQLVKEWTPASETTEIQLPVGGVSTGAYILNIQKLQTTYTQKLIIH